MQDMLYTYYMWLLNDVVMKDNEAMPTVRKLVMLFEDDAKSIDALLTEEYLALTKASIKNKDGNGQRAAALNSFKSFWDVKGPGPWLITDGSRMYVVRRTMRKSMRFNGLQPIPKRSSLAVKAIRSIMRASTFTLPIVNVVRM